MLCATYLLANLYKITVLNSNRKLESGVYISCILKLLYLNNSTVLYRKM